MDHIGILSLAPAAIALILAFVMKNALIAITIGVIVGVGVSGENLLFGFTSLFQKALGTPDFIWIMSIEVFIGIMIALFQKSGAIAAFADYVSQKNLKARGAQTISWLLGIFIFFSDYFSPLYVGTVMRGITDKAKVSREKLAYICDATSAPVISSIPFSAWGIYMAGLLVGIGAITDVQTATGVMMRMAPFNFYSILSVVMVGLIAMEILPDFGPMKKAEQRAREEGKVVGDKARPLISNELERIKPNEGVKPSMALNFFAPAVIIVVTTIATWLLLGSAKVVEALILAVVYQYAVMWLQKMGTFQELVDVSVEGIKSVMSAMLILTMAYCINEVTTQLGTANYVISVTESWMTPAMLPLVTFLLCSFIAFFTGSSWGTYAIMVPICMPLAFNVTAGAMNPIIYCTVAAVMSGGCFGDHCSPLSDTSILSSLAAGSDHIDHVKTQAPYAAVCAALACAGFLAVGIFYSK